MLLESVPWKYTNEASRDRDLAMVGEAVPTMEESFSLDEESRHCSFDRGAPNRQTERW